MKPVLAWVKAHWIIVVLGVVVLVSLPTAWIFSQKWNTQIRTQQETVANTELKKVQGAPVEYVIPAFAPGAQPVSFRAEPNSVLTAWFKEQRSRVEGEASAVVNRAVAFNRGEGEDARAVGRTPHTPLVEGVFPGGADQVDKIRAFEDAILAEKGGSDPYAALLEEIGAGAPPRASRIAEILSDVQAREIERITEGRRELTPEEADRVRKALVDRRFGEYQGAARQVRVFAGPEIFDAVTDERTGRARPMLEGVSYTGRPTLRTIDALRAGDKPHRYFVWQWDLWAIADVFAAIDLANADARERGVEGAVVKRILRVAVREPEGLKDPASADASPFDFDRGGGGGGGEPAPEPTSEIPGMAPLDPSVSFTGRSMGSWNPVYDVRRIDLDVIVSSARLPQFLAAIPRSNLMTVTAMNVEQIDPWSELRQGFYYGTEHVVLVRLEIESVWLREWTLPLMPKGMRERLGIVDPEAGTEGTGDDAAGPSGS